MDAVLSSDDTFGLRVGGVSLTLGSRSFVDVLNLNVPEAEACAPKPQTLKPAEALNPKPLTPKP